MSAGWYALGAIAFGAALGFGFAWGRAFIRQRKKNRALTLLISAEIDANLERLQRYWEAIQEDKAESDEAKPVFRKDRFLQTDLPEWSSELFDTHAVDLASALPEEQMQHVYEFYSTLRELSHLRVEVITSGPVYLKWGDFSEKVSAVLHGENPIADWSYEGRWFSWLLQGKA